MLAMLALSVHCAAAEPALAPRFTMSSENSGFVVNGKLSGTLEIQGSRLLVVVESGTVHNNYPDQSRIELRPVIAARGIRDARRVAEAKPQSIGKFARGESREGETGNLARTEAPEPRVNGVACWANPDS